MSAKDHITVTVYALSSSEDDEIRYIGQTIMSLAARLCSHILDARKRRNHRHHWINSVRARGFDVRVLALKCNATLHIDEIAFIAEYRARGFRLVNLTTGGEGTPGVVPSAEHRAKLSAALKGKKKSPEHITKAAAANALVKRKPFTAAHRAKLGAASTGRKHSAASIAKMSSVQKGRTFSPEAIAKMSATRKGRRLPTAHKEKIGAGLLRAYRNGRRPPNAKVSRDDAATIRRLLAEGRSGQSLAVLYGVSQTTISEIKHNKVWRI